MNKLGLGISAVGIVALVGVGWFDSPPSKANAPALISPDGQFNAASDSCSTFTSWTASEGDNLKEKDGPFLRSAFRGQAAGLPGLNPDDDTQFNGWLSLVTLACMGEPDTAFSAAGQSSLRGMVQMAQGMGKVNEDANALGAVNRLAGADSDKGDTGE